MAKQIFIGFVTEGTSDTKFLESIIQRTFEEIAFECDTDIDIALFHVDVNKTGLKFTDFVDLSAKTGNENFGIMTLCVHLDADSNNTKNVYEHKIEPARQSLLNKEYSSIILTPVVPVQMMEAWLMADKALLKKEIGTDKSDNELCLNKNPEQFADPKAAISEAIRISRSDKTLRTRKELTIKDIYQSIGQKIELSKLDALPSFKDFKEEVRNTYRTLHYLK